MGDASMARLTLSEEQVRALIRHEALQIVNLTDRYVSYGAFPNSAANYRENVERLRELVAALPGPEALE